MTEWKNQPATKGDIYALRKQVEALTILVESLTHPKPPPRDPNQARIPLRSPDLCEHCLGSGFVMDDIDGDEIAVQCPCRTVATHPH